MDGDEDIRVGVLIPDDSNVDLVMTPATGNEDSVANGVRSWRMLSSSRRIDRVTLNKWPLNTPPKSQ